MRTTFIALGAAALAVGAVTFAQTPERPQMSMEWHSAQQAALATRAASGEWRALEGGLLWRRIEGDGTGAKPSVEDTVTVHYAGTFIDGETFDSSFDRGQPATFPLGRLIPAWQLAIPQMGVGDTIEIASPATLAYGPVGRGSDMPGGATLLFKVQLIGIEGQAGQ